MICIKIPVDQIVPYTHLVIQKLNQASKRSDKLH